MGIIQKSIRATKEALEKEKKQLESIQIDLGVNMMTGNVLRDRVSYEFVKKDLQKVIDLLFDTLPEHRTIRQCRELIELIKMIKFFKDNIIPLTDIDALEIAKKLKYEYVPKGKACRTALETSNRLCYIMCGKVICALPTEQETIKRAKKHGITLDESSIALNMAGHAENARLNLRPTLGMPSLVASLGIPLEKTPTKIQRRNSIVNIAKAINSARNMKKINTRGSDHSSSKSHRRKNNFWSINNKPPRTKIQGQMADVTKLLAELTDETEIKRVR